MTHSHENDDIAKMFTREAWNERYSGSEPVWSGNPNVQLVAEVSGLTPGTALEVGSGEGADAVWLAGRGWRVTALDVSDVALEKGAAVAEKAGVGERITWRRADLLAGDRIEGTYDLVTAHFMHLPGAALRDVHRQLAAAVAPGGSLLLVGHHPRDLEHIHGIWRDHADMRFTAEEVAATLPAAEWEIRTVDTRAREGRNPDDGSVMTVHDAVLRAVRT